MASLFTFILFCCLIIFLSVVELSEGCDKLTDKLTVEDSVRDGDTLVSSNQKFELGFFSPGQSKNRFVGIWFKSSPTTVVWVANKKTPLTNRNGVLTLSHNGNLVLLSQTNNATIWSSNVTAPAKKPAAQLLDSGNFVLMDVESVANQSYLWQSFDFPSDTVLPGMKVGLNFKTGHDRYLTSWKSADDPSPGNFTFKLHTNGLPQLSIERLSKTMFRTAAWNGNIGFGSVPEGANSSVFKPIIVTNENESYFSYEPINEAITMRLWLNQSGSLQHLMFSQQQWEVLSSYPSDPCDNYGGCGANSICGTRGCECLYGWIRKSQDETGTKNLSPVNCVRESSLNCQKGEGFQKMAGVKVPDLLKIQLNKGIGLQKCEIECLKNCSCTAYANLNISEGGSSCLMWFGDLIDTREVSEVNRREVVYIRLPASNPVPFPESKNTLKIIALVSIFSSGITFLGLVFCIVWKNSEKGGGKVELEVPLFNLSSIKEATNNFSRCNIIGEGGFGPVYKGNLQNGQLIAVKRLSKQSKQGPEQFGNEVLIAQLQHRNLVGLLGCCIEGDERMLIYEFMPNRSLDYFIFDHKRKAELTWQRCFDIVLGITRGLVYLHQDSKLQLVHRDLKASNILLDSNLNPKISDFGLAKVIESNAEEEDTKKLRGTCGYVAPEYMMEGKYSVKTDVFAFGVLLLEIISGKKNTGQSQPSGGQNLLGQAWLLWDEDRVLELLDSCLEESCVISEVVRCIQVALMCAQEHPDDRPTMSSVLLMLTSEGETLPQPRLPGFVAKKPEVRTNCNIRKLLGIEDP